MFSCDHIRAEPTAGTLGQLIRFRCRDCSHEWATSDEGGRPPGEPMKFSDYRKSALERTDARLAMAVERMVRP